MQNALQPTGMNRIRTLIVDDCELLLIKLREMLGTFPEIEIVAEAANGEEALRKSQVAQPQLVIMDVQMPVMDGFEAARRFEMQFPDTEVILTSAFGSADLYVLPQLKSVRFARKSRLWDSLPKLLLEIFPQEKQ